MKVTKTSKDNKVVENREYVEYGIIDERALTGKWKLTAKISGTLGMSSFGSYGLSVYPHPITNRMCFPVIDGSPMAMYEVGKPFTIFDPDNSINDRSIVNWLLNHPNVGTGELKVTKEVHRTKKSNPDFTLINIDQQDLTSFENQNKIDEVIGRLTVYGGKDAIGISKLRHICAKLSLNFLDKRIMTNKKAERTILQNKVKNYVRKSIENALEVKGILSNLQEAEMYYVLKVLIAEGTVSNTNGMLKFQGTVIGVTMDSAIGWLERNKDVYEEFRNMVKEIEKQAEREQPVE